jgi:hypothetical protein
MFLKDPKSSVDSRESAIGAQFVDISGGDVDVTRDGYCPVLWITRGNNGRFLHVLTADGDDVYIPLAVGVPYVIPLQVQTVFGDTTIHAANIFVLY